MNKWAMVKIFVQNEDIQSPQVHRQHLQIYKHKDKACEIYASTCNSAQVLWHAAIVTPREWDVIALYNCPNAAMKARTVGPFGSPANASCGTRTGLEPRVGRKHRERILLFHAVTNTTHKCTSEGLHAWNSDTETYYHWNSVSVSRCISWWSASQNILVFTNSCFYSAVYSFKYNSCNM